MANFIFCTGIENSISTIDQGRTRVDQMAASQHYERWREDFALVEEMGIHFLRFGRHYTRRIWRPAATTGRSPI